MSRRKLLVPLVVIVASLVAPSAADAFCGFYVSGASTELYNDATMVSMMRDGQTTVLAMRNNYQGPPKDFAMVVPVPEVLEKKQVKTLPDGVFDRLRAQTAPRLVEYHQRDPCNTIRHRAEGLGNLGMRGAATGAGGAPTDKAGTVKVEAQFDVGEYEIVILSSDESRALERWLHQNDYEIPDGAAKYFRPYVEKGSYFFVARVDVSKVTFQDGEALLSPLRFHYESQEFRLPIRLGLINSKGRQDLLVHVFAENQRYAVANRKNVTIPTNLPVQENVEESFGAFYDSLFTSVMEHNPGAVVTEYAWEAGKCDPCPPKQISASDFATLGGGVLVDSLKDVTASDEFPPKSLEGIEVEGDALETEVAKRVLRRYGRRFRHCYEKEALKDRNIGGKIVVDFKVNEQGRVERTKVDENTVGDETGSCIARSIARIRFPRPEKGEKAEIRKTFVFWPTDIRRRRSNPMKNWVVTRLHTRYSSEEIGDDLVFEKAPAIRGGRGQPKGKQGWMDPHGEVSANRNRFQARYAILHRFTGEVDCEDPNWNRWGGSLRRMQTRKKPTTAGSAPAPKGRISVPEYVDWKAVRKSKRTELQDEIRRPAASEQDEDETTKSEPEPEPESTTGTSEDDEPAQKKKESPPETAKSKPKTDSNCNCAEGGDHPPLPTLLLTAFALLGLRRFR